MDDVLKTASALMLMAGNGEIPTEEKLKEYSSRIDLPTPRITEVKRLSSGFDWKEVLQLMLQERSKGGEIDD
jgi:hypothetical protein